MKSEVFISRYVAQSGQAWTTSRLSPKTRANCRVTWLPQLTHRGRSFAGRTSLASSSRMDPSTSTSRTHRTVFTIDRIIGATSGRSRCRRRLIPIETLQISNVLGPHSREIQYYRSEISYFGPVSSPLFVVPERPNRDCRIDHSDPTRFGTIRIRSGSDSVPERVAESSRGIGSATHRSAARDASTYRSGCIQPSLESTTVTDL